MAYKAGVIGSASYLMNPVVQMLRGRVFYAALPSAEVGSIAFSISRRMASVRDGILACALRQFSIKESVLPSRRNLEAAIGSSVYICSLACTIGMEGRSKP